MASGVAKRDGGRVIVIGAGFSGSATAAQLLRRGRRVTLIERNAAFGPGLAYGEAAGEHLLNVVAARMSAFPEVPTHFVAWLERRLGGDWAERFAPRKMYGAYLQEALREAASARWPSRLTRLRGAAVACRREGEGWAVTLANGRAVVGDAVVLAVGAPRPAAPAPFAQEDMIGAWDRRAYLHLPRDSDVLLMGAGLTMVDVALALAPTRRKGVIYALSRRGRLPLVQGPRGAAGDLPHLPTELSAALQVVRKQAAPNWRATMDALRAAAPDIWMHLGEARQRRFLRHLRPWWDSHRHRLAPEIDAQIKALIAEGRLRILAGEIAAAAREGGVWRLQHRGRGSRVRHRIEVAGVINCTGADFALARSEDPLVRQLLDEGLARAPANGVGFDVDVHNRLCDRTGAAQPNLYVVGPLALGAFWESVSVPELRHRAAAVARALE